MSRGFGEVGGGFGWKSWNGSLFRGVKRNENAMRFGATKEWRAGFCEWK